MENQKSPKVAIGEDAQGAIALEVTCPDCSTVNRYPWRDLSPETVKSCEGCASTFKFSGDDLSSIGAALDRLNKGR